MNLEDFLVSSDDDLLLDIGELKSAQMRARSLVYPENHYIPVFMSYDEHAKLVAQIKKIKHLLG